MRAIRVAALTGPEDVELAEVDRPSPGSGEVLIEVAYAGVTFPELLQTRGMYQTKHELPFVLGSEAAGVVVEAGTGSRFAVGDRVAAIPGKGSFADFMIAGDEQTVPVPDGVSLAHAAGMPMNLLTADFALRIRAQAQAGQSILVQGSGRWAGLSHGADGPGDGPGRHRCRLDRSQGPDRTRSRRHPCGHGGWLQGRSQELYPDGVDYVFDPVGGDRFTDSTRVLAPFGRLLVLGFTAGEIPSVKVNRLLLKNISVDGVAWGAATRARPDYIAHQWDAIAEYVAAGKLNPAIHATFSLDEAAKAIGELDSRSVRGKVLLELKGE